MQYAKWQLAPARKKMLNYNINKFNTILKFAHNKVNNLMEGIIACRGTVNLCVSICAKLKAR